ncbi:MAG TPA: cation diffusion facilitator family transporter [Chloroflexota bacterium]
MLQFGQEPAARRREGPPGGKLSAHAGHGHAAAPSHKLGVALVVSAAVLGIEAAGGIAANSLALLSDAGHMLTDVLALGLAWYASRQAERPANARQTYGFHRAGILAALANAATLVALAVFISYEAYQRLFEPEAVASQLMLGVAVVGLVANLLVAWYLQEPHAQNLNLRAALAHVLGDALASAAVIVGAIAIALGGPVQIDPVLSVLIGIIIVAGGWSIIRETLNILMESAPPGVDVGQLVADLRALPGVTAIHDVHVWRLASDLPALSVHVRVDCAAPAEGDRVLDACQSLLREAYGIDHTTIQIERRAIPGSCPPDAEGAEPDPYCRSPRAANGAGTRLANGRPSAAHAHGAAPHDHDHTH